ncbi:MAG: nucleotide kinase domain-containing protein [Pseudomonadota bacterium]
MRVRGNTVLIPTDVYDSYWTFATKRQAMFISRVHGAPAPWTSDPILANHRFTNAYRASDRVSQYLIRNVIYAGPQTAEDVFFRTMLFKIFNKIETWETLIAHMGEVKYAGFDYGRAAQILDAQMQDGKAIYSAAYIMPQPRFNQPSKHRNHLCLLEYAMREGMPHKIAVANSLEQVYRLLLSLPSFGRFLSFQMAIDLNYSEMIDFSEMDFVVAGPGAQRGIQKCFVAGHGLSDQEVIQVMADRADQEFERLGLNFQSLWGRPLQLIDCQNLFCEVDKYARVAYPHLGNGAERTRIKQKYTKPLGRLPQWYPPKWRINDKLEKWLPE